MTQLLQCQTCVSDHADCAVIMAAEVQHPKDPDLDQVVSLSNFMSEKELLWKQI